MTPLTWRKHVSCFLAASLFSIFLLSCSGDLIDTDEYSIDKVKATPSLALPLVAGKIGIADFLNKKDEGNIKVYPSGLVYLMYEQTLVTKNILDVLQFPDKQFSYNLLLPVGTLGPKTADNAYTPYNTTSDFAFDPEKLNEIKFSGQSELIIDYSFLPFNPANGAFALKITLPTFRLNGVSFEKTIVLDGNRPSFSLENYVGVLDEDKFPIELQLIEKAHNSTITIADLTTLQVDIGIRSIQYKYIKGFFADQTTNSVPADAIKVKAFGSALKNANVSFKEANISFTVINEYGIPVQVLFNPLVARKNDGSQLPIQFDVPNPVVTRAPTVMGEYAQTVVNVTNGIELFEFVPDDFFYSISARINPGLTNGENFCTDTSSLDVKMKIEVPLYGQANGIVMADTFALDLEDLNDTEFESAGLLIKVINELPLDASLQILLADEDYIVFDSLISPDQTMVVKSSSVTASGELQSASTSNTEIPISNEKMQKLLQAEKLIVRSTLSTTKSGGVPVDVQFKSTYQMDVSIGLKVKLKLEAEL